MKTLAGGFREGDMVTYENGGNKYLATVVENYRGSVEPGCVPIDVIRDGVIITVPADALTRK